MNSEIEKEMQSKLKRRREELRLTQKEVAEKTGIPEQAYQRYEYDRVVPSAVIACRMAKALFTTVEELYGD